MPEAILPQHFDFKRVKPNLLLLRKLKRSDLLQADRRGGLVLLKTRKERLKFYFLNAVTFGRARRAVNDALYYTTQSFLYEMRTPHYKPHLLMLLKRKRAVIEDVIEKLTLIDVDTTEVKKKLREFTLSLYLQLKILASVKKACLRAKETTLIKDVKQALTFHVSPIKTIRGFSGTYIMRNREYKPVGVFKPFDEEIGSPNNPTGNRQRGPLGSEDIRRGVAAGTCLHREVAAFEVSKFLHLNLVPKTTYATFPSQLLLNLEKKFSKYQGEEQKYGSFQEYKEGFISFGKFSKEEQAKAPLFELQKLFILDVIIGHLDRHFANILYDGKTLVAIDNGLAFSSKKQLYKHWYWLELPQLKEPLLPEVKEIISNISSQNLLKQLYKRCYLPLLALEHTKERIHILQEGAKQNLTPIQITEPFTGNGV